MSENVSEGMGGGKWERAGRKEVESARRTPRPSGIGSVPDNYMESFTLMMVTW